jgi:hypothetical protein
VSDQRLALFYVVRCQWSIAIATAIPAFACCSTNERFLLRFTVYPVYGLRTSYRPPQITFHESTLHSYNYSSRIDDSPYHLTTGQHVDITSLHPFWARVYVHIPLKYRKGKVGHPRAYQGHFVGYLYTSALFDNFIVLEVHSNRT